MFRFGQIRENRTDPPEAEKQRHDRTSGRMIVIGDGNLSGRLTFS
jgi:hypothetical protein